MGTRESLGTDLNRSPWWQCLDQIKWCQIGSKQAPQPAKYVTKSIHQIGFRYFSCTSKNVRLIVYLSRCSSQVWYTLTQDIDVQMIGRYMGWLMSLTCSYSRPSRWKHSGRIKGKTSWRSPWQYCSIHELGLAIVSPVRNKFTKKVVNPLTWQLHINRFF